MAQAKQQKEIAILLVLALIAGLVWYRFFGASATVSNLFSARSYEMMNVVDYQKPIEQLDKTRATEYKPSGRNIFVAQAAASTQVAGTAPEKPKEAPRICCTLPQKEPPPPLPVLAMKFFGVGVLPSGGARRAFLQDGDSAAPVVVIVAEGDIVKNHIRITHIGNDRIEFEDVNTGAKNSENLEMPSPPA